MHLSSLKIQNFRLLEDVEVKKLGHVNLIVGKNNSGKSTVLEALTLLAGGFQRSSVSRVASNRDDLKYVQIGDTRREIRIAFENFFTNRQYPTDEKTVLYIGDESISLTVRHVLYEEIEKTEEIEGSMSVRREQRVINKSSIDDNSTEFERIHSGLQIKISDVKPKILNLDEDYNLSFRKFQTFEERLPFSYIDSHVSNIGDLAKEFDNLVFTDDESLVVEALKIIEPNIENLAFLNDDYEHRRFNQQRFRTSDEIRVPYIKIANVDGRTPLHSMGDGVIRLLQIIIKLFNARNGFLLIDEFENGLHYSVQPNVWRLIFELAKRYNIQVFATTHSWDCIESFSQIAKEREDLEGVLFRMGRSVRKSDKNKVIATEFDEDELYNLTKDKIEVR